MRMCVLIKQHTTTLVHLCADRLQRMEVEERPASHVPCLLCGNQRRRRRTYTWCRSPVIYAACLAMVMTVKTCSGKTDGEGVAVHAADGVWKGLVAAEWEFGRTFWCPTLSQQREKRKVKRGKERSGARFQESGKNPPTAWVWGANGFQMSAKSFVFSKQHKTFSLTGI